MAPEILGGKYAGYIVPAFAISIVVIAWLIADTLLRARKWRKKAEALMAHKAAEESAL